MPAYNNNSQGFRNGNQRGSYNDRVQPRTDAEYTPKAMPLPADYVEKAEEIMEQFKVCDFSKDIRIPDGNSTGDYLFTLSNSEKKSMSLPNGKTVDYSIDTYKCNLSLGEEYEKYTCEVQVNSLAYAVLSGGYVWDSEKNTFKEDSKGNPVRASEAMLILSTVILKSLLSI